MATLVISYSRADQPQVRAIVSLLKAALRDVERAVFWDGEFEPGEPWFEQIKTHIDATPQLFVFWCAHASTSPQVRREFEYAFQSRKRVVPVLLDSTALCDELAPIAGIDLRGAVIHGAHLTVSVPPVIEPATAKKASAESHPRERDLSVQDMRAVMTYLTPSSHLAIISEFAAHMKMSAE